MKKNLKIKFIILFISVFFFSHNAFATSLELNVDKTQVNTGEILNVTLFLNSQGESINTIEGDLKYDDNFIKPELVNIGSSFISFWVEKPDMNTLGVIHFSGIIPGGISTTHSEMFEVIFRAKNVGDTNLLLNNVNVFLNDGKGTIIPTKINNINIKIMKGTDDVFLPVIVKDTVIPEKFVIIRTKDQSIYDNKWFIVFSTMDKGSGVDHYQVCEFFSCVTGESPFLLKQQTPFYRIVVQAYDANGNVRSSVMASPLFILLLMLVLLIAFVLGYYLYRRDFHLYKV